MTLNHTAAAPLPIAWMAPEDVLKGSVSTKGVVWTYGVVVWEILTLGATPHAEGLVHVRFMHANTDD